MKTSRMKNPSAASPELLELLAKSAATPMTPEMKRAQRRSWVRGEMMLEYPEMTAEYINKRLDEAGL